MCLYVCVYNINAHYCPKCDYCHKTRIPYTPSPSTKSFPTKSPRVEISGRPPIKSYGHENSNPLELRVRLSQVLRNPNS